MSDSNPQALFSYVAAQLNRFGLAYLHIIEARVKGNVLIGEGQALSHPSNCGRSSMAISSRRAASNRIAPRRSSRKVTPIW
jgi:hypothetical protein